MALSCVMAGAADSFTVSSAKQRRRPLLAVTSSRCAKRPAFLQGTALSRRPFLLQGIVEKCHANVFHRERIIKTLEDIRDSSVTRIRINDARPVMWGATWK